MREKEEEEKKERLVGREGRAIGTNKRNIHFSFFLNNNTYFTILQQHLNHLCKKLLDTSKNLSDSEIHIR